MKRLSEVLDAKYIGHVFTFKGREMELTVNEFTDKLVLDNEEGMISIDRIKVDETCPFCKGNGFTYTDICVCVEVIK